MGKNKFSIKKDNWGKFEKNNVIIPLNVLYVKKEKRIYPACISKNISNHEKQVILLVIPNIEKWHYLAMKKLSVLSRGVNFPSKKII